MNTATFTVDAALLRELGERLIGRSYIALAELVKNAYDADATNCRITFGNDEIVVEDDGHGISEPEFHEHWMRIGTTHKTAARVSRDLRRPMTGSKGIGRLSVQFLADEMEIETATADEPTCHLYVYVDWTSIHSGENLSSVNVLWERRNGPIEETGERTTGTRITLTKLRSEWKAREIGKLGEEIWLLRPPFARFGLSQAPSALDFFVDVHAPEIEDAKAAFDKRQDVLFGNWKASIEGYLEHGRQGGDATIEVGFKAGYPSDSGSDASFSERLELPVLEHSRASPQPQAIDKAKFRILVFKTEGKQPGGVPVGEMREYLRRFGNVSVYDSGFRLPYYGASLDWLDVARDQGRRLIISNLLPARLNVEGRYLLDLPAPGRIFGSVEIDTNHERKIAESTDAEPGTYLQIQPGRDRLGDNVAFEQLRNLVRFSLDFYASRYRLLASQALERKKATEAPSKTFGRAVATLERNEDKIPPVVYHEVRRDVVAAEKASAIAEEDIDRRAVLLAPLATAGMAALALNHELGREIPLLQQAADRLRAFAQELESSEFSDLADRMANSARRLRGLREMFLPLATEEDREATARLRVEPVVQGVVRAMAPILPGLKFDFGGLPSDLRFPVAAYAEWNALLQNVLANAWNATLDSKKALVGFDAGRRGRAGLQEWFRVSDTGVGLAVDLDQAPVLFEPFERRLRIRDANRSIAIGGQGLGLTMVRMIAQRRATQAAFVTPRAGYATSFELSWRGAPK